MGERREEGAMESGKKTTTTTTLRTKRNLGMERTKKMKRGKESNGKETNERKGKRRISGRGE